MITFVALSNVYTCRLLLRGATSTGASDYEQLAFAIGGFWARLWSEIWIVLLLVGTNIGAIIQMGESFGFAISSQWPDAPNWLWDRSGTAAMLFFTLCVIFPLCMLPQMRKLELVGAFGSIILWVLAGIVMVKSCIEGLPALADGDFPKVSSNDLTSVSETFSLFCFAFYHQVMMMPLLSEMPRVTSEAAKRSAKDLNKASAITILLTSGLTYWVTGFFGAAMYGATNISDNLLENEWLPGVGTFILNLAVTIYLAISIPPIFHATNHTVESWLLRVFPRGFGGLSRPWVQRFIVNCCTILPCLGVALGVPGESGTVLSFTGATGVAMCSYILPVIFHFVLYFGKARCMRVPQSASSGELEVKKEVGAADLESPLNGGAADGSVGAGTEGLSVDGGKEPSLGQRTESQMIPDPRAPPGLMFMYRKPRSHAAITVGYDIVLPILVFSLGCFFSVATLVLLFQPAGEE